MVPRTRPYWVATIAGFEAAKAAVKTSAAARTTRRNMKLWGSLVKKGMAIDQGEGPPSED